MCMLAVWRSTAATYRTLLVWVEAGRGGENTRGTVNRSKEIYRQHIGLSRRLFIQAKLTIDLHELILPVVARMPITSLHSVADCAMTKRRRDNEKSLLLVLHYLFLCFEVWPSAHSVHQPSWQKKQMQV